MPSLHESRTSEVNVNTLIVQMLRDIQMAAEKLDTRVRDMENARLYERGYRKGVVWIVGIICSAGGSALTMFLKWKLGL